jgi:hypothetical protein
MIERLRLRLAAVCGAVLIAAASLALGPATAQSSGPALPPTALGAEAQAFNNLLDLYDAWRDARAKLEYAGICGNAADVADAYDAVQAARAALDRAMEQYIRDFSDQMYVGPVDKMKPADRERFEDDWDDLMSDLEHADKKKHPVGECPRTPAANGPPEKKPHPATPPETPLPVPDCFKTDADRGDLIVGLQKQRIAAGGDPPAVAAIDAAIIRAGSTAACPAGDHGPHVTIGVGIGVGDDHHHHDEHHDDRPRN